MHNYGIQIILGTNGIIFKSFQILITFRVSWRRSFNEGTHCDANTKLKNHLIGSDTGDMVCLQGCRYGSFRSNIIGSMRFYCTDFSDQEDWTSGESTLVYTFPESSNHFYQFGYVHFFYMNSSSK